MCIRDSCHTIAKHLAENGIQKATIRHRVKSIYGIYRKMYMQNKDFEEIYDIYAVRIILENVSECYNALGLIHDMYHPLPNRFKDYISTPKPKMCIRDRGNIDATILCQRPKLAPHIPAMRKNIADAFGLPLDAVSVKATTEEHLGFTGEGLGIAAHAVALIE